MTPRPTIPTRTPEPRYCYLGLDPAARSCGVALIVDGLRECDLIRDLDGSALDSWLTARVPDGYLIVAAVEYPTWKGASKVVRAVANVYLERVKRLFPRRVKATKTDPRIWQLALTGTRPKEYDKALSVSRARADGWKLPEEGADGLTDLADAANLAEYAKRVLAITIRDDYEKRTRKRRTIRKG